jgi:hypothetical protein
MNDIARQARRGSVAAIIQILNEKLASSGVRTRAMFSEGALQLLCEAAKVEQLEQSSLVDRVRQILERISPRNVRRVNINSRIVREQQLLWLEEIHRNPEDLLWSEEITLVRPNPVKRFFDDRETEKALKVVKPTPSPREARAKQQYWRGIIGGVSLSALLLLVGWVVYTWLRGTQVAEAPEATTASPIANSAVSPAATPATSLLLVLATSPAAALPPASSDPFVQAVRLAEQTAREGKGATTSADWLNLATRWQEASDLMSQVTAQDERYSVAQDRTNVYRQNSEAALQKAESVRE